jgi:hypothetical protein
MRHPSNAHRPADLELREFPHVWEKLRIPWKARFKHQKAGFFYRFLNVAKYKT